VNRKMPLIILPLRNLGIFVEYKNYLSSEIIRNQDKDIGNETRI
jgi:hypothetical protein